MPETSLSSALAQGLQGCAVCTSVGSARATLCKTCGSRLHGSSGHSIQATWAWLITAVVFYIPANVLPITHTKFLGRESENTILGGVVTLWEHGSYPIAIVIFVASVFVPIAKILVLTGLLISVHRGSARAMGQKTRLYRVTEFVGRWSMVDVFVVGVLVALIQLGSIMTILPGTAAMAFAAMVATTMLAAMAFDPRLIWRAGSSGDGT